MRDLEEQLREGRARRRRVGLAQREGYLDDLFFRVIACISASGDEESIASVVLKTWNYVDAVIVCDMLQLI